VNPEWQPPHGLRDPYIRRMPAMRTTWSRAIRGQITQLADVAVARTLADYGNKNGANCRPGIARLAHDLCSSEKTVMRSLRSLYEAGWITFTERGARKLGHADTYRLTIPAPVAVELELWTDDNGAQWMERPGDVPKRPASTRHRRPLHRQVSNGHQRPLGGWCRTGSTGWPAR
jgi:Helix-turn-helix domain